MTRYGERDSTQLVDTEHGEDFMLFLSNNHDRTAFLSLSEDGFDWDLDLSRAHQTEPVQAVAYLTATECFELATALLHMGGQLCRQPYDYRAGVAGASK